MDLKALYSHCEEQVKRHDPERYLCTLLFPDAAREKLMPLFAFNQEIASTAALVSEPMIGLIRLTWWREGLEQIHAGQGVREHPVLQAMAEVIRQSELPDGWYQGMIAARERDVYKQPFDTLDDFTAYCDQTSSVLLGVAAQLLGASGHAHHDTICLIGRAWAAAGLLRSVPHLAREGRCALPLEILKEYGLEPGDVLEAKRRDVQRRAITHMAAHALAEATRPYELLPAEIKPLLLFHTHAVWWLTRIVALNGNIFDLRGNNGRFWLLIRLWLASRRIRSGRK